MNTSNLDYWWFTQCRLNLYFLKSPTVRWALMFKVKMGTLFFSAMMYTRCCMSNVCPDPKPFYQVLGLHAGSGQAGSICPGGP